MKHFIEDLREKPVIKIPITIFLNDFFSQTEAKNVESKEQSVESIFSDILVCEFQVLLLRQARKLDSKKT